MALRHRAKYIDGKLKFQDRDKFTKEMESFKGEPFDIVLGKELRVDRDYLRRYYFASIVDAYGKDVGLTKNEAHESLKDLYGFRDKQKIDEGKLNADTLESVIELMSKTLKNFAGASNIATIRENNKIYLEYTRGYSSYTEKEMLNYHDICRNELFQNAGISIPKETEVSL